MVPWNRICPRLMALTSVMGTVPPARLGSLDQFIFSQKKFSEPVLHISQHFYNHRLGRRQGRDLVPVDSDFSSIVRFEYDDLVFHFHDVARKRSPLLSWTSQA